MGFLEAELSRAGTLEAAAGTLCPTRRGQVPACWSRDLPGQGQRPEGQFVTGGASGHSWYVFIASAPLPCAARALCAPGAAERGGGTEPGGVNVG